MVHLGDLLKEGDNDVSRDAIRARTPCERAVDAGNVDAMACFGDLFLAGEENVPTDVVLAK